VNILVANRHAQGLGLQSLAMANLAVGGRHVPLEVFLLPFRESLIVAPFHVGDDAGPRLMILKIPGAFAVLIDEIDRVVTRPIHDYLEDLFRQILDGRVERELIRFRQGFKAAPVPGRIGIVRGDAALVK